MKYAILGAVAATLWYGAGVAAAAPRAPQQDRDRWTWSGRLPSGRTLEIRGINGSISAEPARGDQIEVVAMKHARRSDPDDVRIDVVEHDEGVTICAVYPGSRGRSNTCERGGGRSNTRNNDVEVEFTVRVPRGIAFQGHNVNGDVDASGLDGPVTLGTVNGGVRLETTSGDAEANTVNGSITAIIRAVGTRPLRFRTVNGGINLSLPAGINADLDVQTVNGSINTDFPVAVIGRMSPRRLTGRIGQGGRTLDLATVNGSIRLRSLP